MALNTIDLLIYNALNTKKSLINYLTSPMVGQLDKLNMYEQIVEIHLFEEEFNQRTLSEYLEKRNNLP